MMVGPEQRQTATGGGRRRRAILGGTLAVSASLGLTAFPLLARLPFVGDVGLYATVCGLTAVIGIGAVLAIFNLPARWEDPGH